MVSKWITLIMEFNCYEPGPAVINASVWLFTGQTAQQLGESNEEIADIPGGRKVMGPVEAEVASQAFEAIKQTLTDAGIAFDSDVFADD